MNTTMTESDTKTIDCPSHPGEHTAELHLYPHKYAGIWECSETGESDVHDHSEHYEIETVTSDHLGINGHYQTDREIYVCAIDGVAIDLDVADPLVDKAEAAADMEQDCE